MYIVFAILSCFAMFIDLDPEYSLSDCFTYIPVTGFILVVFCFMYYDYCRKKYAKNKVSISALVISFFISCMIPVGISYDATFSPLWMYENFTQIKKTLLMIIGYLPLFYHLMLILYESLDCFTIGLSKRSAEHKKNMFLFVFLLLLICYLPTMFISYPGIFMGDTDNQIVQAFSELESTGYGISEIPREFLLSDKVSLNQHHSVIHTLMIHLFLVIGINFFHSVNIGIFLYCIFQTLVVLASISYALAYLASCGMSRKYILGCVVYYIVHPYINYSILLITKDTIYSAILLFGLTFLYSMFLKSEENSFLNNVKLMLAFIGLVLMRNEAQYVLILALLGMILLCKKYRKRFGIYLSVIVLFSFFVFKVLMPVFYITPGNVREVLSIPLQQTARYVKERENEVTDEEKEAISNVLNYSLLADNYNPIIADPVKLLWKYDASREEIKAYLKVWLQMFWKHPDTYLQATINNYYQYLYPCRVMEMHGPAFSEQIMGHTNEIMEPMSLESKFEYPVLTREMLGRICDIRKKCAHLPIIIYFMQAAAYNWLLICMLAYCIHKRTLNSLAFLSIPVWVMIMCFAGPCNGYFGRYTYPILFIFPILLWMVCALVSKDTKNSASL